MQDLPSQAPSVDLSSLRRLGQGRAAEIFALDEARVLKAMRQGGAETLAREAEALRAAWAAGMPVPEFYELLEVDGRSALVMSRVPGQDMLSFLGARPWRILGAGARLGRLHARLHEVVAPPELPSCKDLIVARLAASARFDPPLKEQLLARLAALPDGDRLCHLDFGPPNVMISGEELVVIDWPSAARGDPACDFAFACLILESGTEPPGTPLVTRLLAPLGRKLLLDGYRRAYKRARAIDPAVERGWRAMAAAQRLTYEIAGEEAGLWRVLHDAL